MGHVFYGTDPWPTWPIHICRPIWPMTYDPWPADLLSALLSLNHWMDLNQNFLQSTHKLIRFSRSWVQRSRSHKHFLAEACRSTVRRWLLSIISLWYTVSYSFFKFLAFRLCRLLSGNKYPRPILQFYTWAFLYTTLWESGPVVRHPQTSACQYAGHDLGGLFVLSGSAAISQLCSA